MQGSCRNWRRTNTHPPVLSGWLLLWGGLQATVGASRFGTKLNRKEYQRDSQSQDLRVCHGGGWRPRRTCTEVKAEGTITEATTSGTVTPTFSGCTASPGTLPATVLQNGCNYTASGTKTTATTGDLSVTVDCPAGKELELLIYENATKHAAGQALCAYSLGPQGPLGAGVYHDQGSGSTETVSGTGSIAGTGKVLKGTKILCGATAGGTVEGTITGLGTLSAKNAEGKQIGVMAG
jgi:hypothetical protein